MEYLKQILLETVQAIEATTVCFYQNKTSEGYRRLDDTLLRLGEVMTEVGQYRQQGNDVALDETETMNKLTEALKALEMKDTLLLADILEYEIKDILMKGYSSL